MKILKLVHDITGIKFYLYCGYVPCGMEYTCIFSKEISDKQPKWWRWFFDGGVRLPRSFYKKLK